MTRCLAILASCLVTGVASASAQDYRIRVDAGAQAVSVRGLVADSIPVTQTVPAANGGVETPDGYAVRCGAGDYCHFMRPGPMLRAIPATTSASVVWWGLGAEGLTLRATGRLITELGSDSLWRRTTPFAQLIEGYLDYQRPMLSARAGRQLLLSRLEPMGFDGGWVRSRWDRASLSVGAYGGWGLGQAAALPASSPALNPLDEWRPRDRQIVAGTEASFANRDFDVRAEYRRETDPEDGNVVSERAALSFVARAAAVRATGGLDHNIAEGRPGNADLTLTYLRPRYSISAGARRYRPYFSLWTLWGAFSPVPYHAANVSAEVRPTGALSLHARGERYRYDDAEISAAIVPRLEDRGWRIGGGATATHGDAWTLSAEYGVERGPGASARFSDAALSYAPGQRYSVDVYAGELARPLELRHYDATSRWLGGRAQWRLDSQQRVWADITLIDDDRERPDAAASSLAQVRLRAGMSLALGNGADRTLPPARGIVR